MNPFDGLAWPRRFAGLGPDFFTELTAQGLPDPHWVAQCPDCAQLLSLPADWVLAINPAVVLRNHLAEGAIRAAQRDDFTEIERLLKVLSRPFDEPAVPSDAALPPDWAQHLEVSCSS